MPSSFHVPSPTMDKILLGISASAHQEGVKKALFLKMMSTASKPLSTEEVTTILQLSSCWVIGEEEFLQDMGLQVGLLVLQLKCYLLLNCVSYLSAHKTHFCLRFPWSIFAFPIRQGCQFSGIHLPILKLVRFHFVQYIYHTSTCQSIFSGSFDETNWYPC